MKQLYIMITLLLISLFFILYSLNNTINSEKVIEIYKKNYSARKLNSEMDDIYLTKDLISSIFHTNTWIIGSNNIYLYINAFSGKILKEENYSNDSFYILPKYIEETKNKVSIGILALYVINIFFVIFKVFLKFVKPINLLIITFILFIDIISYIVVYLSMLIK